MSFAHKYYAVGGVATGAITYDVPQDPSLHGKFVNVRNIVIFQTDTLFIHARLFLLHLVRLILKEDEIVSMDRLVTYAAALLQVLISERPHLVNIFFGCEIPTNLPKLHHPPMHRFSKRADVIPWAEFSEDQDFVLGTNLYSNKASPEEAVQDQLVQPLLYRSFFRRLFKALEALFIIQLPLRVMYINVLYPLIDITAANAPLYPNTMRHSGSGKFLYSLCTDTFHIGDPVIQLVHVFKATILRAYNANRAFHMEYHDFTFLSPTTPSTHASSVLIALLLQYVVQEAEAQPYYAAGAINNNVIRSSPFHYLGVTMHHSNAIVSLDALYKAMGSAPGVPATVATELLFHETVFWPGLEWSEEMRLHPDMVTLERLPARKWKLSLQTEEIFNFLRESYWTFFKFLANDPASIAASVDTAMGVYYHGFCRMENTGRTDIALFNKNMLTALMTAEVVLRDSVLMSTVDTPYLLPPYEPGATPPEASPPFAGHMHLLSLHRRVTVMAWTLSYYLAGDTHYFSPANSVTAAATGKLTMAGREYDLERNPLLSGMWNDIGITVDANGRLDFREVDHLVTFPIIQYNASQAPPLIITVSLAGQSTHKPEWHLNKLMKSIPFFVGCATHGLASPEEEYPFPATPEFASLRKQLQALNLVAADKLVQVAKLNPRWMDEFVTVFTDGIVDDKYTPDAFLCLLYVWGVNVMLWNKYRPHVNSATGIVDLAPMPLVELGKASMTVPIPLFIDKDESSLPLWEVGFSNEKKWTHLQMAYSAIKVVTTKSVGNVTLYPDRPITTLERNAAADRIVDYLTALSAPPLGAAQATGERITMRYLMTLSTATMNMLLESMPQVITSKAAILSPIPEVYDYIIPLMRRDASPAIWDGFLSNVSCLFMMPSYVSWLGVIRWKLFCSALLKKTISEKDNAPPQPLPMTTPHADIIELPTLRRQERVVVLPPVASAEEPVKRRGLIIRASKTSDNYLNSKKAHTWAFAYCFYKNVHPTKLQGNYALLRDTIDKGMPVIQNLALAMPSLEGIELSITKEHIYVFFIGWNDADIDMYVDYVFVSVTTKRVAEWTDRLQQQWSVGTSGIAMTLTDARVPVYFYKID